MALWLRPLRELVDSQSWLEAMETARSLSANRKDACLCTSDFLALEAQLCMVFRQWDLARFLSKLSLAVGNFSDPSLRDTVTEIHVYTCGYDLVARQYDILSTVQLVHELETLFQSATHPSHRGRLLLHLGHCPIPDKAVREVVSKYMTRGIVSGRDSRQAIEFDNSDWVRQVDASEIGNEARYANHADMPNGILVNRGESNYPHLVALRDIEPGDEITINYGSRYWEEAGPGADPLWLGMRPNLPFSDCIYYNGVIEDWGCSDYPGGLLMMMKQDKLKMKQRNPKLQVKNVPESHPAYPGFGLFATTSFFPNEVICIYAGIVDASPHSFRQHSKYTLMLDLDHAVGFFGLRYDPVDLIPLPIQAYLPFLTPFPDISLPLRNGEPRLDNSIKQFRSLDQGTTRNICRAVHVTELRESVVERFGKIRKPYDNGKQKDEDDWCRMVKKEFADIFTKPARPPTPQQSSTIPIKKLRNEIGTTDLDVIEIE